MIESAVLQIKLSTKSFGLKPDNSAEVVVKAFEAQSQTLTDLDLSDVIAGPAPRNSVLCCTSNIAYIPRLVRIDESVFGAFAFSKPAS